MNVFDLAGELILGTRFKRLSEKFLSDVSNIYHQLGIDFEPSWFGIFYLLDRYQRLSVGELSKLLGITNSAVSQLLSQLVEKGLINISDSLSDKRMRIVEFSTKGHNLLTELKPVWKLIKAEMKNMLLESQKDCYLLDAIAELERVFEKKPLAERVIEAAQRKDYTLKPYEQKYYSAVKKLLFQWAYNFYIPPFLKDFYETQDNLEMLIALSRNELLAVIVVKEDDAYVVDRDDVSNDVAKSLTEKLLTFKTPRRFIFDFDKPKLKEFLKGLLYQEKEIKEFKDSLKRLAIYER